MRFRSLNYDASSLHQMSLSVPHPRRCWPANTPGKGRATIGASRKRSHLHRRAMWRHSGPWSHRPIRSVTFIGLICRHSGESSLLTSMCCCCPCCCCCCRARRVDRLWPTIDRQRRSTALTVSLCLSVWLTDCGLMLLLLVMHLGHVQIGCALYYYYLRSRAP